MKKIFSFGSVILFAILFIIQVNMSSCTKTDTVTNTVTVRDTTIVHDTTSGITVNPNAVSKIVVHTYGSSEIDTLQFSYDTQGRLAIFTVGSVDTAQLTYFTYNLNFLYSGANAQPYEYAFNDDEGDAGVDLLSYNSSNQLALDSTLVYDDNLYINYSSGLIANSYSSGGIPTSNSDSLWFGTGNNLSQWADDSIVDPTASPVVLSRSFLLSYDSYTSYNNPLYSLNNVAGILFEFTEIDPAFFYSENLLSSESENGQSFPYQYVLNGTQVQQANGYYILDYSYVN